MNLFTRAYYILRYLGPRVVTLRASIYLKQKLGMTRRRFASRRWDSISLSEITLPGTPTTAEGYACFKRGQSIPFLFPLGLPPEIPPSIRESNADRQPSFVERLRLLEQDRCVYFFHRPSPEAIDWHRNPYDGTYADSDKVWCEIPDFVPSQGDPRILWEPSRAAWAFDLARAGPHGITIDAGTIFWRWVDSWMSACQPFRGFQWKCGQECSVRLIAIAIGLWSLANDPATTPDRWIRFARLAWATGYRVRHHIGYAISQKNNHALTEACGLLLISHLFPEFREAAGWNELGRRVFIKEILRQTYADGSYIQHSMNYHRVMLHVSLLAMRLAELAGNPFPHKVYDRISLCGEFLYQMMDSQTGRVPNYGNNDGACVLSLNECDCTDYRPIVQSTHFMTHSERRLPAGPWDEDLLWLFGPDALSRTLPEARPPHSTAFEVGGYYTLRSANSSCMIRCHSYRDRPGHDDSLHMDLWWRGLNILQDCGTYRYYAPGREDVEMYFKSARAHNTLEIEGASQLQWASRFLFFPWPRCRKLSFNPPEGAATWFEGERNGGAGRWRPALHRRTVVGVAKDVWLVIDDLLGTIECSMVLRWHLMDAACELDGARSSMALNTPDGPISLCVVGEPTNAVRLEVVRGREDWGRVQGFASLYYGERSAIPTLEASFHGRLPQRLVTFISCGASISGAILDHDDASEQWHVRVGARDHILRLARLSCGAPYTFLGWRRCNESGGKPPALIASIIQSTR